MNEGRADPHQRSLRRHLVAVTLSSLTLLSACGDEPNEAAMRTAVQMRMEANQRQLQSIVGVASAHTIPLMRVVHLKKGSCREAQGQTGHACHFTLTYEDAGRRYTTITLGRFYKSVSGQIEMEVMPH